MADEELLDVLDADGRPQGGPKGRVQVHRDGDWHAAFHLWVVGAGRILLQRRAADRGTWAGMLDATAAGHLTAGEAPVDGLREAEEELGIRYAPEQLVALGVHRIDEPRPLGRNREHQHVYAVVDPRPLESFTRLDPVELAGLVELRAPAFEALLDGERVPARSWDGERVTRGHVGPDELVPAVYLGDQGAALARLAG